ncbi:hypothetical protein RQN30_03200 [Arcanobacterium hippocoleae]
MLVLYRVDEVEGGIDRSERVGDGFAFVAPDDLVAAPGVVVATGGVVDEDGLSFVA